MLMFGEEVTTFDRLASVDIIRERINIMKCDIMMFHSYYVIVVNDEVRRNNYRGGDGVTIPRCPHLKAA